MKKEISPIIDSNKDGVTFRATTRDERFYIKPTRDLENGLPVYKFYPSVTWIVHYYFTSPFLQKWRDEKGPEAAEAIKIAAGEKGSAVHFATEILESGGELWIGEKIALPSGETREMTVEEWESVLSYKNWFDKLSPQVLATEITVFNDQYGYAGTVDNIMAIGEVRPGVRQIWILDKKTSKMVAKGHMMQISAYKYADIDYKKLGINDEEWKNRKLCILQLGYNGNKAGYKFTEIEDKFKLFLSVMETWKEENPNTKPRQIDLPMLIKLGSKEQKVEKEIKIKKK